MKLQVLFGTRFKKSVRKETGSWCSTTTAKAFIIGQHAFHHIILSACHPCGVAGPLHHNFTAKAFKHRKAFEFIIYLCILSKTLSSHWFFGFCFCYKWNNHLLQTQQFFTLQ